MEAARTAPDGSVARGDLGEDGDANRNPHSEENQTFRITNSSAAAKWVIQIFFFLMEEAFL